MHEWHKRTGKVYITSGVGYGKTELSAFDAAELDAQVIATNVIKVSSFVPPNWQIVHSKEELGALTGSGAFLPMAYTFAVSDRRRVAASLLIGTNRDKSKASIIVEHADMNITGRQSLAQSAGCLEEAFAARGWEIDKLEQAAVEGAPGDGLYVCVLVAAVFLVDPVGPKANR